MFCATIKISRVGVFFGNAKKWTTNPYVKLTWSAFHVTQDSCLVFPGTDLVTAALLEVPSLQGANSGFTMEV